MEPNSREFYKQCAFQKFCNTVLHNEACDTHRELRRHNNDTLDFSGSTLKACGIDQIADIRLRLTVIDSDSC